MKKDKSEIVIILDRSGSMSSIKQDMVGGFKTFLEKQKLEKGECSLSLFQFNEKWESIYEQTDIKNVTDLTLEPYGSTALYDAIVKTVNKVGQRLSNTPENERPENVIFLIVTDGEENASREFSSEKVSEVIKHQTEKYNWSFVYLGANQDAILAAQKIGIAANSAITYSTSSNGINNTWNNASTSTTFKRSTSINYAFTPSEKAASAQN